LNSWIAANSTIEDKLKNDNFKNFYEFQKELEKLKEQYETSAPQAINRKEFWLEYSHKTYALAAEALSKTIEESANIQVRRLTQRLEMTEAELDQRKRDFENEKEGFYTKLHDLERERAVIRAQENSNKEKLDNLRFEKEKYEHLYQELKDKYQAQIEQIESQSKVRGKELEVLLDEKRTEFHQASSSYEKKLALLEQELHFLKKENEALKDKTEKFEAERKNIYDELKTKEIRIEVNPLPFFLIF
jgi:hypothetical protein